MENIRRRIRWMIAALLAPALVMFAAVVCSTSALAQEQPQPVIVSAGVEGANIVLQVNTPVIGEGIGEACFAGTAICLQLPLPAQCTPPATGCTFYSFAIPADELLHGEVCLFVVDLHDRQSECTVITLP
jgi:hypothetical protein